MAVALQFATGCDRVPMKFDMAVPATQHGFLCPKTAVICPCDEAASESSNNRSQARSHQPPCSHAKALLVGSTIYNRGQYTCVQAVRPLSVCNRPNGATPVCSWRSLDWASALAFSCYAPDVYRSAVWEAWAGTGGTEALREPDVEVLMETSGVHPALGQLLST